MFTFGSFNKFINSIAELLMGASETVMDTDHPDHDAFEVLEFPELYKTGCKRFRVNRLANGMKVILVRDDVRDNYWPSIALSVAVGSLSDPSDLPGLAQCVGKLISFSNDDRV